MTYLLVQALRLTARRCLPRPTVSGGLLLLATVLFALDHNYSDFTWGAVALATGALLTKGKDSPQRSPADAAIPASRSGWHGPDAMPHRPA